MRLKRIILLLIIVFLLPIIAIGSSSGSVLAATFNKNNIMSDTVFDDSSTMTTSQIQSFLNSFPNSCLKNYQSGYPEDYFNYGDPVPASKTIRRAADLWHINPRVILATLEKEESLVSGNSGCASWRYNSAMGMGCPDGGACPAPGYAGFSHQVTKGSWQLKFSKERAYGNLDWDDDSSVHYYGYMTKGNRARSSSEASQYYDGYDTIDDTAVYMSNGATAALYTYTPHFHGNQVFFDLFNQWFGSTYDVFVPLDKPRWMETTGSVYKENPSTGENVDAVLPTGTQLKFVDKIDVNGVWYLRTAADSAAKRNKGIPQANVADIPYESFDTPRYMILTSNTYKMNPRSGNQDTGSTYKKGLAINFNTKIYVNGQWYYRSTYDASHGIYRAIPASKLADLTYAPLKEPRYMITKNSTRKLNPATGEEDATTIAKNTQFQFSSKMSINGDWYYRTNNDTNNDTPLAIPASDTQDIPYTAFASKPKWLQLKTASTKVQPRAGGVATTDQTLPQGTQLKITGQITVNGVTYYRTVSDTTNNFDKGLPASVFEEIPYVSLDTPREMSLKWKAQKYNPKTATPAGSYLPKGTKLNFTTKILINGQWYLRTEYDTAHGLDKAIFESSVKL